MRYVPTWRPLTALSISMVAAFCAIMLLPAYTAAYPAPPSDVPGQEPTLLDAGRATSPPITEEELHQMIEDLLMEAYGDEYEPPTSSFKTTSLSKSKNLPVSKPQLPALQSRPSDLQSKSSQASPFLSEGGVLSTVLSPRPQSRGRLLPQTTKAPLLKSNVQLRGIRRGPPQQVSFLQNVPDISMKSAFTSAGVPRQTKPTAKISKLSSSAMSSTVPETIAQTLTSSELMGAVLVEQDDQPNILIVDRRTKNKDAKVLNSAKALNDFQRNSRSPVANNAPFATPVAVSEPRAPDTASIAAETSDVNLASLIQPATLLSHIKSEDNKPFKSVDGPGKRITSRPVKNNPTTDTNIIQLSPAPVAQSQAIALPVKTPFAKPQTTDLPMKKQNAAKSFSDDDLFDSPNAFTLPNLHPVSNPSSTPILDVDDVDDEDLLLLELLGSRMNKAGFGSEQSITPAVRLGTSLNLGDPTSPRKSSVRQRNRNENSISLSGTGQSRASSVPGIFSDEDKIVIDLATIGSRGAPLPLLTGNSNSHGNFFPGKEIGTGNEQQSLSPSNRPSPSLVTNLDSQIDSTMTVGDLIRSLDGLNGIQVLSLSDLRNQQDSEGVSAPATGTTIADHLRATMLSKTTETGSQSVGVPLPSIGISNSIAAQGAVQVASENPGRQFDQTDGFQSDNVFENFFDESTRASRTVDDVGIPLAAVADNAAPLATTSDSLSTTLDDTNGFPLEENTDLNFEEYEDEFDDLPAQPESVFRRGISDIFFTKGQWLGTVVGGVIDIVSSIRDGVSKVFNKSGSSSSS